MNEPGTLERWTEAFAGLQDGLFTLVVSPLLQDLGLASFQEDGYVASLWLTVGLVQMAILLLVFGLLERWRPFEAATADAGARRERRQAVRVDVLYTLVDRLGLVRLAMFFTLDPLWHALFGRLAVAGVDGWHLDQWMAPAVPGITDTALAGFLAYAVLLDGFGYLIHRAQHRFGWWWALHAVHHSQRHMTCWSDSRNHLLDSVIVDSLLVLLARVIGVAPSQFVLLVALSKLLESLSHANADLSFGRLGERLLVGPRFHRLHHGIGIGDDGAGTGRIGGCNFAVLLPVWDLLCGTARFGLQPGPTGIGTAWAAADGGDHEQGFWNQQIQALQRMARSLRRGGDTQRS